MTIAYATLIFGIAAGLALIAYAISPLGRRIEDAINRWLCWREIRQARGRKWNG